MGKVLFSVCSHLGGGGGPGQMSIQPGWVWGGARSKVNPARGNQVKGQCSQGGSGPASGGGGQVQPAGGDGVSILHPLAGGMPLAFTQEDFLVLTMRFPSCILRLPFIR